MPRGTAVRRQASRSSSPPDPPLTTRCDRTQPSQPGCYDSRLVRSALLLGVLAAFGCARTPVPPAPERPSSVLLVTVDTLRADRLGSYGDAAARTPAMDALASSGVLFAHAYTPAPITLPAHTSILTGLAPPAHGVRGNGAFALGPGTPTVAEALRARGLATAAFIGGFPLARRFGLARGFDAYDDAMGKAPGVSYEFAERRGDAVVASARAWLNVHPGRVFVWVHLFDPHAPYDPPPAFRGSDPYRGEIAATDAALAALMTALERAARAVAGGPDRRSRRGLRRARRGEPQPLRLRHHAARAAPRARTGMDRRARASPPRPGSPTSRPPSSRRSGRADPICPAARCDGSSRARPRSPCTRRRWRRASISGGATSARGGTDATSTSGRRGPSCTTWRPTPPRRGTCRPRIPTSSPA